MSTSWDIGRRTAIVVLAVLLLTVAASDLGAATPRAYTGEGVAVVVEDDLASASKLAFEAARRAAIGKALDRLAEGHRIDTHDYNLKRDEVLRGRFPFVMDERVVSRNREGSVLRIVLEVTVDESLLLERLGVAGLAPERQTERRKAEFPTVVVVVGEELNGRRNSFPYSTQVINDKLGEAGYRVVDRAVAERAARHDEAVQAVLNGDLASARAVALQTRAGVLVAGRAIAQKSGVQSGAMQAFGATVALQAVVADTGRVLANATADGSYPHVNALQGARRAIEEAAVKAIDELLEEIDRTHTTHTKALDLSITGINFEQLAILKKILQRDFPEVRAIRNRSFVGDVAILELDLAGGSPVDFAERLALHDFENFKLTVLSSSPGKLDTRLSF